MSALDDALVRLRSMANRPLPPEPDDDPEMATQLELAAQYQADLRTLLAEFDRLRGMH